MIEPEILEQLEEFSSLMFTVAEIAIILEVNPAELKDVIEDPDTDFFKAFQKGRLQREAEVRTSIFNLAKNGSSPAQLSALKLIENAKMDDV